MNISTSIKKMLLDDIQDMAKNQDIFVKQPGIDFSRDRKLTFPDVLHFLIAAESDSLQMELFKFFKFSSDAPTPSAFVQARDKLSSDALPELFYRITRRIRYDDSALKGYTILASDGSTFSTSRNPKEPDCFYPPSGKSTRGYNAVHVNALYDLDAKLYADCVVQPIRKRNEFHALCEMIDRIDTSGLDKNTIVLADRGQASYNVFAHAIEKGVYFAIRAKDSYVERLLRTGKLCEESFDVTVHRILTSSLSVKKRRPGCKELYRTITKKTEFDFLDDDHKEYDITLRVVRFPISDTSYENIITNIPEDELALCDFKELYNLRWGIETSFRDLKYAIGAVCFHSKRFEHQVQEIWARLLLYNLCSVITKHIALRKHRKKARKHSYQVNYSLAIKICHKFLHPCLGEPPPDIENLIGKSLLPIRLERTYPHNRRFKPPATFLYRFS